MGTHIPSIEDTKELLKKNQKQKIQLFKHKTVYLKEVMMISLEMILLIL